MSLEQESRAGLESADSQTEGVSLRMLRRKQEHDGWDAYWQVKYLSTEGSILNRVRYYAMRAFDKPVTFFRKSIVEPMQDRNKRPYYQRQISRVPDIDTCPVNDLACLWEANEQFRLDRGVDFQIVQILRYQYERCFEVHFKKSGVSKCLKALEEFEEADLNCFIKYGELGNSTDVKDCYMKQKHRLIWERRHPEIMAERQRLYELHKQAFNEGDFDMRFWKTGLIVQNSASDSSPYMEGTLDQAPAQMIQAASKDPQYYREASLRGDERPDQPKGSRDGPAVFNQHRSTFGPPSTLPLIKSTDEKPPSYKF
jgi:NADH dehydrogenase (ubiquinone) 1 beta subcomplex subunit 10